MNGVQLFDWPFFVLLFAVGIMSACATLLRGAPRMDLPVWSLIPAVRVILTLIALPLLWSPAAILIYGFLTLPWYTVLICAVAAFGAIIIFIFFVLSPIMRMLGISVVTTFLLSCVAAIIAVLRYFEVF